MTTTTNFCRSYCNRLRWQRTMVLFSTHTRHCALVGNSKKVRLLHISKETDRPKRRQTLAPEIYWELCNASKMAEYCSCITRTCHCANVHNGNKLWLLRLLQKRCPRRLYLMVTSSFLHHRFESAFDVIAHTPANSAHATVVEFPHL